MGARALVGEEAECLGQIQAAHLQRAVVEVAVQHRVHVVVEVAEGLHQVSHGRIARAVLGFGFGDDAVDQNLRVTRQAPHKITHRQDRHGKARLVDIADHQGTGVDKRIARAAALEFQLHHGVERLPGRLVAQAFPDAFAAMVDGLHQAEHLGDTLHREQGVGITGAIGRAVVAIHGNTELIGGHIGQRGNVVGDFTLADQWTNFVEDRLEQGLHVLSGHVSLNQ